MRREGLALLKYILHECIGAHHIYIHSRGPSLYLPQNPGPQNQGSGAVIEHTRVHNSGLKIRRRFSLNTKDERYTRYEHI